MTYERPRQWLAHHPFFTTLRTADAPGELWSMFAEGFAPLIYSVPAFLGVTLAKADDFSSPFLIEVWSDELGAGPTPSHPVLFEIFHRFATSRWGHFPELHQPGVQAAGAMVALCASGAWPVGVAAMAAHESQFPEAYSSIIPQAISMLESAADFFRIHATADVEHSSSATSILREAVARGIVTEDIAISSFESSTHILKTLIDQVWEACVRRGLAK